MTDDFKEELADEGILSGVQEEGEEGNSPYQTTRPFDPDSISINSKVVALDTVLRRIKNKTIKLAPDFQRSFVWDKKRKSQLIESMVLKIPLPMFYVAEDENGVWEVVDGLQRLSTIRDFIIGEDEDGKGDKLSGLEFLGTNLNGKTFFSLERDDKAIRLVNNIMESELAFTIINPDTPEEVKRNIFKRINTGGMRLSDQEIRHALYQGRASTLLLELVQSEPYKNATDRSVKDNRMAGRELILRFLAFNIEDVVRKFKLGISRSVKLFGKHAFRNSIGNNYRRAPINKSLFEVWINLLSEIGEADYSILLSKKVNFLKAYEQVMLDEDFGNSISRHGGSSTGASTRYRKLVPRFI